MILHWMTCSKCTSDVAFSRKYARLVRQTLPIVILGTSAWFIALVIELARNAQSSSIWICLVGIGLGLLGTTYILRGLRKSAKNSK